MLQATFEALLAFAHEGPRAAELRQAREEYLALTGDLFEGDDSYERRTDALLQWYVLDRAGADGQPPIVVYLQTKAPDLTPEQRADVDIWRQSRLSLFELGKARAGKVTVSDLLTGGSYALAEAEALTTLEVGSLIIGRLLPATEGPCLSDGLFLLPMQSRKEIRALAKKMRKQGATPAEQLQFAMNMAYFANRCERWRHVDPRTIFASCAARTAGAKPA